MLSQNSEIRLKRLLLWGRPGLALSVCLLQVISLPGAEPIALALQVPSAQQTQKYRIEILSAAGKPTRRRQNMISSESVIRISDSNDRPVAGVAVMFALTQLTGGSATFANGAASSIVTTNAAGIASTGSVTATATSSFNISVSATVSGQALNATIPVNMAAVAAGGTAGAAGAAAGAGAGAGAGISGAVIGVLAAAGVAAAVVAAKTLGGDSGGGNGSTTPANPRIRIGGPGTPTVTAPQP